MLKKLFLGLAISFSLPLCAARPPSTQWQRSISDLQQDLANLEDECSALRERLRNQETVIDDLRDQVSNSSLSRQDLLKNHSTLIEERIRGIETTITGAVDDIKQFRKQSNQVASHLNEQKQRIDKIEKASQEGQHNLAKTREALETIFKALDIPTASHPATYSVRSGDSLGTIAQKHHTTIQVIKKLNNLKGDRIYSGQKLKLPE